MSDDGYAVAELAEQVRGSRSDESDLPEFVGRVPPRLARILAFKARAVDGDLGRRGDDAVSVAAPERATRAIEQGHPAMVAFETGVTDRKVDSSALGALAAAGRLVRHAGQKLVLTGGTDNGKTNVVLLLIDVADRLIPDLRIIGNVSRADLYGGRWLDRYREVETQAELEDALHDEPEREKFVLVDDASLDHGEGLGSAHEVRERAGRTTRLAAKMHARVAYLAHRDDGKGVAKHLREMPDCVQLACNRVLDDDGHVEEYIAAISRGVGDSQEFVETLGDLPEAQTGYDPDAVAHELFTEEEDVGE